MESNEAMSTVFYGKQYRELRVFAENEQVVHDIGVGDPAYIRRRENSQTIREPGIMEPSGRVYLVDTGREETVQPMVVFHIVSNCADNCGSTPYRPSLQSYSIGGSDNGVPEQEAAGDITDLVTLQKRWLGLVGSSNATKWNKDNLQITDLSTRKQGQYFGLMKEIYISLTQHPFQTYVMYNCIW